MSRAFYTLKNIHENCRKGGGVPVHKLNSKLGSQLRLSPWHLPRLAPSTCPCCWVRRLSSWSAPRLAVPGRGPHTSRSILINFYKKLYFTNWIVTILIKTFKIALKLKVLKVKLIYFKIILSNILFLNFLVLLSAWDVNE